MRSPHETLPAALLGLLLLAFGYESNVCVHHHALSHVTAAKLCESTHGHARGHADECVSGGSTCPHPDDCQCKAHDHGQLPVPAPKHAGAVSTLLSAAPVADPFAPPELGAGQGPRLCAALHIPPFNSLLEPCQRGLSVGPMGNSSRAGCQKP